MGMRSNQIKSNQISFIDSFIHSVEVKAEKHLNSSASIQTKQNEEKKRKHERVKGIKKFDQK